MPTPGPQVRPRQPEAYPHPSPVPVPVPAPAPAPVPVPVPVPVPGPSPSPPLLSTRRPWLAPRHCHAPPRLARRHSPARDYCQPLLLRRRDAGVVVLRLAPWVGLGESIRAGHPPVAAAAPLSPPAPPAAHAGATVLCAR